MIQIRGVGQIGFVSTAEKANFDFVKPKEQKITLLAEKGFIFK